MAAKLLNLVALSSLAILACSFGPSPVSALSADSHGHVARHAFRGHDSIAKRKRANTKRCKARTSSTLAASTSSAAASSTAAVSTTAVVKTSTTTPKPTSSKVSTTSKAAATTTSSSSSGSSGSSSGSKVALAWPNGDDKSLKYWKTDKVSVLYTWSPYVPSSAKSLGFNAVPMLWGENQVSDFKKLVVKGYANTVLGFNEPNQSGQSDMTPARGAELWQQYIQPLKYQGYSLISPATTSAPSGKTWMKNFFAACSGCTFDGVAVHYYDVTAEGLIAYVKDFHTTFGYDIWITEYACQNFNGGAQCSKSQVESFMATSKQFFDSTPWVAQYAWFGAMHDMQNVNYDNQLMSSSGAPNDLGYQFLN